MRQVNHYFSNYVLPQNVVSHIVAYCEAQDQRSLNATCRDLHVYMQHFWKDRVVQIRPVFLNCGMFLKNICLSWTLELPPVLVLKIFLVDISDQNNRSRVVRPKSELNRMVFNLDVSFLEKFFRSLRPVEGELMKLPEIEGAGHPRYHMDF